jgi:carbon monoxide dehydrogenase subunit G
MPSERFERSMIVRADPVRTWTTITDVDQLVSWISILSDVDEHEPLCRYSAVLTDRVGMFSLRADLAIDVTALDEGRSISLQAEGRDRQVDSRIFVEGTMTLGLVDGGTLLEVGGRYEVTGRVATFGGPMIRSKADTIIEDFFGGLEAALS